MLIDEWAAASPERHAFFTSLHQSWLEAGDEVYRIPDVQQAWAQLNAPTATGGVQQPLVPAGRLRWPGRIAAAAAILLVAIGSYFLFNNNINNGATVTVAAAQQKDSLRLDDGTVIALHTGSEVSYPERFSGARRDVQLTGNAFFKVAHDSLKPFGVHFDDLHVKVLGTSFEIMQSPGKVTVRVWDGKVAFYNRTDTLVISAGHTGQFNRNMRKFTLLSETIVVPATAFFDFKDVPLQEVAARLSDHFKVDIILQNAALKHCRLSAVFEHKTLEEMLIAISETFNLTYQIEQQHIYINGKGCE